MRRAIALTAVLATLLIVPSTGALPSPASCRDCWNPNPTTQPWQWQLQGKIDLSVPAPVYDIDMDVARANVKAIHDQNDRGSVTSTSAPGSHTGPMTGSSRSAFSAAISRAFPTSAGSTSE